MMNNGWKDTGHFGKNVQIGWKLSVSGRLAPKLVSSSPAVGNYDIQPFGKRGEILRISYWARPNRSELRAKACKAN